MDTARVLAQPHLLPVAILSLHDPSIMILGVSLARIFKTYLRAKAGRGAGQVRNGGSSMVRSYAAAALLLLMAAPICIAEPTASEDAPPPWYKRLFSSSKPKPAPKPPEATTSEKPPTWKDVSRSLEQETALYLERINLCTRLRQIATETGDEALIQKADALEQQADFVFKKRTKPLESIVKDVKTSEAALEQRRQSTAGASASRVGGRSANGRPIPQPE